MNNKMNMLRERLGEIADVQSAVSLLSWDQEVCMPPKAAPGRGRQLGTLSAVAHRMFTSPGLGKILKELRDEADALRPGEAKLVEETLYDYERAVKLPETFVQAFAEERSKAYETWVKARKASRFDMFKPHLEKLLDLLKQKADLLGYEGSPYNALLEDHERGMTAERIEDIFGGLQPKQTGLVERILNAPNQPDTAWLEQQWDTQSQWDFTMRLLPELGYDLEAGRQDRSVHPFTTNFDIYDVRITTRLDPSDLFAALTGSIHECGHALYEQGFMPEDRRTPLAGAPSLGLHESQSRMWENMIGRSLPFWRRYLSALRQEFPGQLDGVAPEDVFRCINRVRPSFIRVEADECTYNLHIILRFEIERDLIEGTLVPADIPDAWNAKTAEYLGLDVPDDAHGCLQDIHWSHGLIGYFPTYALGNLYAAQLFQQVLNDLPKIWDDVEAGDFGPFLAWLRENVHRWGRRKTAVQIVRDATGSEPGPGAYLRYLEGKYTQLYKLASK